MQIKAAQLVTRHLVNVIQRNVLHVEVKVKGIFTYSNVYTRTCSGHMAVKLFLSLCVISFLNSCSNYNLPMHPSKTSLTTVYGADETDKENEKDTMKNSYKITLKQDWIWEKDK